MTELLNSLRTPGYVATHPMVATQAAETIERLLANYERVVRWNSQLQHAVALQGFAELGE